MTAKFSETIAGLSAGLKAGAAHMLKQSALPSMAEYSALLHRLATVNRECGQSLDETMKAMGKEQREKIDGLITDRVMP
jgi:hypothetical protein